jgi:PiT family inorganic phosphate transporter
VVTTAIAAVTPPPAGTVADGLTATIPAPAVEPAATAPAAPPAATV